MENGATEDPSVSLNNFKILLSSSYASKDLNATETLSAAFKKTLGHFSANVFAGKI